MLAMASPSCSLLCVPGNRSRALAPTRALPGKKALSSMLLAVAIIGSEVPLPLVHAATTEADLSVRQMRERRAGLSGSVRENAPLPAAGKPAELSKAQISTKRSHGFMPLFLAQFLLLVAVLGAGAGLFIVPDSSWKQLEQEFDDILGKSEPYVEKARPVISQATAKAQELGDQARPYIAKAVKEITGSTNRS